jgi:hypothetical protein
MVVSHWYLARCVVLVSASEKGAVLSRDTNKFTFNRV